MCLPIGHSSLLRSIVAVQQMLLYDTYIALFTNKTHWLQACNLRADAVGIWRDCTMFNELQVSAGLCHTVETKEELQHDLHELAWSALILSRCFESVLKKKKIALSDLFWSWYFNSQSDLTK